jgi:hypothetical protein
MAVLLANFSAVLSRTVQLGPLSSLNSAELLPRSSSAGSPVQNDEAPKR